MVSVTGEPSGRSPIVLLAAVVGAVGATVTALFPFTVALWERVIESATIILTLLFVAWVFWGGPERAQTRREARIQRERIRTNLDLVDRLDALIRRGAMIFGEDNRRTDSFGYGAMQAEQAVFGHLGKELGPKDDDVIQAQLAQSHHSGWNSASPTREQAFALCLLILSDSARTDTQSFVEAYRLARSILVADYGAARAWLYWMRNAHPLKWNPHVADEWARFREEANRLAQDWELFGIEAGNRIGVEGSYSLPLILDVRIGPGDEDLPRPSPLQGASAKAAVVPKDSPSS